MAGIKRSLALKPDPPDGLTEGYGMPTEMVTDKPAGRLAGRSNTGLPQLRARELEITVRMATGADVKSLRCE